MIRCRPIASLAAALLLGAASAPPADAQPAAVEGVARAEDGGAPIPFALVRLVPADSAASPPGTPLQGITSAEGRFRFGGLAAGRYRVLLLRIGHRPELSDPVRVAAGETAQLPLRVASQALQLPAVRVTGDACVRAEALAEHPQVLTLWQQARDGASIREGLMARFRYDLVVRQERVELRADGPGPVAVRDHNVRYDPKWSLESVARTRAHRLSRGYYAANDTWAMPDEQDVLHEDFLRAHCFEASVARGDGEVGLRFRPLRARRGFLDVGGTIWLDSATYLARRLELEYVDGEEARGTVRLDFGDVVVAGGTLRMPVGATYRMRPSRKNPDRRTEGKLTFAYADFEEVRSR